jgi:hypothetical protein
VAISDTDTKGDPKQTDRLDNTPAMESVQPRQQTEKADETLTTSTHNPENAFATDGPSNSSNTSGTGVMPSVDADPTSCAQDIQKQQGADRPCENPSGGEGDVIRDSKQEAENAQKVDTSSPDSRTFAEAHGDSGNKALESADDGLQKSSLDNGTGENYIKSKGTKADGGDFDAAKPGAGREANRKNSSNLRI